MSEYSILQEEHRTQAEVRGHIPSSTTSFLSPPHPFPLPPFPPSSSFPIPLLLLIAEEAPSLSSLLRLLPPPPPLRVYYSRFLLPPPFSCSPHIPAEVKSVPPASFPFSTTPLYQPTPRAGYETTHRLPPSSAPPKCLLTWFGGGGGRTHFDRARWRRPPSPPLFVRPTQFFPHAPFPLSSLGRSFLHPSSSSSSSSGFFQEHAPLFERGEKPPITTATSPRPVAVKETRSQSQPHCFRRKVIGPIFKGEVRKISELFQASPQAP